VEPADPNFQPGASSSFAPVSFVAPQQQQQQGVVGRVQSAFTSLLTSAAAASAVEPDADLAARRSLQAVSAQVDPNWPTAVGVIKFRETQRRVPETFLATSHEWTRLTDYGGQSADAWAEIFRTLSPSPVLRIGGATQDKLIHVPKDETWVALQQLQKKTNTRYDRNISNKQHRPYYKQLHINCNALLPIHSLTDNLHSHRATYMCCWVASLPAGL
jgi:hypothetical protein